MRKRQRTRFQLKTRTGPPFSHHILSCRLSGYRPMPFQLLFPHVDAPPSRFVRTHAQALTCPSRCHHVRAATSAAFEITVQLFAATRALTTLLRVPFFFVWWLQVVLILSGVLDT